MSVLPQRLSLTKNLRFPLLWAYLVTALLFSGVYVVAEGNHNHVDYQGHSVPAGDSCRICLELQITLGFLESTLLLCLCAVVISAFFYRGPSVLPRFQYPVFSLRSLKVRFNC